MQTQPLVTITGNGTKELPKRLAKSKILGSLHIARDAYRNEGLPVFFRGLGICSVRAFIVNAAQVGHYSQSLLLTSTDPI